MLRLRKLNAFLEVRELQQTLSSVHIKIFTVHLKFCLNFTN